MKQCLQLRNVNDTLFTTNGKTYRPINENKNFMIHVDKEKGCDSEPLNCISEEAYNYLTWFINNHDHFSINVYQVEGTTTDYTIIENNVFKNATEMRKWLRQIDGLHYKYVSVDFETLQSTKIDLCRG